MGSLPPPQVSSTSLDPNKGSPFLVSPAYVVIRTRRVSMVPSCSPLCPDRDSSAWCFRLLGLRNRNLRGRACPRHSDHLATEGQEYAYQCQRYPPRRRWLQGRRASYNRCHWHSRRNRMCCRVRWFGHPRIQYGGQDEYMQHDHRGRCSSRHDRSG